MYDDKIATVLWDGPEGEQADRAGWRCTVLAPSRPRPGHRGAAAVAGLAGDPTEQVILGEGPSEYESEIADFRQNAIAHFRVAAPFAVAQFSAFCEPVIEQFKR